MKRHGRSLVGLLACLGTFVAAVATSPLTVGAAEPQETVTVTASTTHTETATATAEPEVTTTTVTASTTMEVTITPTVTTTQTATATATHVVTPEPEPGPTVTLTETAEPPKGDVYDTPGFHESGGRRWMTVCEPYSVTVRCWTYIWGTQVQHTGGRFVEFTGWVFNNLTYVSSPRSFWAGNPLGNKGTWTDDEGRLWRTDCDSQITGRNGCRSWITTRVAVRLAPGQYGWQRIEVFNNMVRFS